jgi:hypothetical protein
VPQCGVHVQTEFRGHQQHINNRDQRRVVSQPESPRFGALRGVVKWITVGRDQRQVQGDQQDLRVRAQIHSGTTQQMQSLA